ncbi:Rho GTPase-activating protein 1 [Yarrowia sp. B02]|nr:Rho GTPase-activating protein 1 [Yarrowia sp. B02]
MFITTKAPDKRLSFDFKYTDVAPMSTHPVTMISSSPVAQPKRFSLNRMFSKKGMDKSTPISVPMDPTPIDDGFKRDSHAEEQKEKAKQELLFLIGEGEIADRAKKSRRPSTASTSSRRPSTSSSRPPSRLSTHSEVPSLRPMSTRSSRSSRSSVAPRDPNYYFSGLSMVKLASLDASYRRQYAYGCKTVEEKKLVHQLCSTRDLEYLPLVLFRCIREINRNLTEVGVYKVNASPQKIEELRRTFTDNGPLCDLDDYDVHTLTSFLKNFLRQLPDDLFPNPYQEAQPKVLVSVVKTELGKMSKQSIVVLRTLCTHIQDVSNHHETNKMTLSTLARILAPSLRIRSSVLETLVKHTPELWYGMEGNGVYTYEAIEVEKCEAVSPTPHSYPAGLFPSRLYSHDNVSDESLENQINGVVYCGGVDSVDSDVEESVTTASPPRSSFEFSEPEHSDDSRQRKCTSVVSTSTTESQLEPRSPITETSSIDDIAIVGQAVMLNPTVTTAILREYKKAPLPAIPQDKGKEPEEVA